MKNYIHIEPSVKRKDRKLNNLNIGDKIVVTLKSKTTYFNNNGISYTEIEIEPLEIIRESDMILEIN